MDVMRRRSTLRAMFRLFALGISTTTLAIVLSRLFQSTDDESACFMGIDGERWQGGKSCIVGIAAASLSSLVCIVFLAIEIFSRDGLLSHFYVRPLGIVDFTLACITCLLWFFETIYAIRGFVVTVNTFDNIDEQWVSTTVPTYFRVAAAFFCTFSGLSVLIWGVIAYLSFHTIGFEHQFDEGTAKHTGCGS